MQRKTVTTASGKISGFEENGLLHFMGIPYALPPVGKRRFMPPQKMNPWEGVYDAALSRPIAMQTQSPRSNALALPASPFPESEDCLYLDVITPSLSGKRPVLVNLHGGADINGSRHHADPTRMVRDGDLVYATIEFRLGAFGFLYHPDVNTSALADLDIIMALEWIKSNIGAFGGDAGNITLIGYSAGGNCIAELARFPSFQGLAHKGIVQSAALGRYGYSAKFAAGLWGKLLEHAGVDMAAGHILEQAQAVPAQKLVEASYSYVKNFMPPGEWGFPFRPVKEGCNTPLSMAEAEGRAAGELGMTLMVGFCTNEHGMVSPESDARETWPNFIEPALEYAKAAAAAGAKTWVYEFQWYPKGSPFKACHTISEPFTWRNFHACKDEDLFKGTRPEEVENLYGTFGDMLIRFIRYGNPVCEAAQWKPFTPSEPWCKFFNAGENPLKLR